MWITLIRVELDSATLVKFKRSGLRNHYILALLLILNSLRLPYHFKPHCPLTQLTAFRMKHTVLVSLRPRTKAYLFRRMRPSLPGTPGGKRISKSAEDHTPRKTTTVEPFSKRGRAQGRNRRNVRCFAPPTPFRIRYCIMRLGYLLPCAWQLASSRLCQNVT
jgi:hypothetical protein